MKALRLAVLVACGLVLAAPPAFADVRRPPRPPPPPPPPGVELIVAGTAAALAVAAGGVWLVRRTRRLSVPLAEAR